MSAKIFCANVLTGLTNTQTTLSGERSQLELLSSASLVTALLTGLVEVRHAAAFPLGLPDSRCARSRRDARGDSAGDHLPPGFGPIAARRQLASLRVPTLASMTPVKKSRPTKSVKGRAPPRNGAV